MNTSSSAPAAAPATGWRRFGWTQFAAPLRFDALAARIVPWCWAVAAACGLAALWVGFAVAPSDATQGQVYRILFIHVPAAWLSMVCYLALAMWAVIGWVWNVRMASRLARALAPTGALYTAIALWTGALWGQPTWGTWWAWDARMTSELILLFLYIGFMSLHAAIDDPRRADRAAALLALVGVVNVPIIYFSVRWWNTLHQGASVSLTAAPSMASTMLTGMLLMALAAWAYCIAVVLARVRVIILEREHDTRWARQALAPAT